MVIIRRQESQESLTWLVQSCLADTTRIINQILRWTQLNLVPVTITTTPVLQSSTKLGEYSWSRQEHRFIPWREKLCICIYFSFTEQGLGAKSKEFREEWLECFSLSFVYIFIFSKQATPSKKKIFNFLLHSLHLVKKLLAQTFYGQFYKDVFSTGYHTFSFLLSWYLLQVSNCDVTVDTSIVSCVPLVL